MKCARKQQHQQQEKGKKAHTNVMCYGLHDESSSSSIVFYFIRVLSLSEAIVNGAKSRNMAKTASQGGVDYPLDIV